ncbi:MAG: succinate dehydrogenase/fumarate reductase iron-sulfur subunit [Candidatus Binatia bacterium]
MKGDPTIILEVFRYRPEQQEESTIQAYEVPYRKDWVVLDALNYLKDCIDGTLSFRWSCRMGVCGSCGMMVNGEPKLTCAAFLREYYPQVIRVEPLAHFPVVRDLVVDITDFMEKLRSIQPWIIRDSEQPLTEGEYRQTPAELARYKQFSMCINCMLCYAACPVYGQEPSYLGPAAIALARRYNLDSRDQGRLRREGVVAAPEGVWLCTAIGECSVVCPKHVDPSGAIQQTKIASAGDVWTSLLLPWGKNGQ